MPAVSFPALERCCPLASTKLHQGKKRFEARAREKLTSVVIWNWNGRESNIYVAAL